MNKKVLIGTLVGAVASFLLGWLLFGILLADVYKSGTKSYEGLMYTEPILWALFLAQVAWSWVAAWLWDRLGVNDLMAGITNGAMLLSGIVLGMDLFFYASMDLIQPMTLVIDVVANTVMGGFVGGVIAFTMSKVK